MNPHLLSICKQLYVKRITPTVALLRAKSSSLVSLPQAVAAIKEWNDLVGSLNVEEVEKELRDAPKNAVNCNLNNPEASIAELERRLEALEIEVSAIRSELSQLKSSDHIAG